MDGDAAPSGGSSSGGYRRSKNATVLNAYINKRPAEQIAVTVVGRFDGLSSIVPGHPALAALHQQLEAGMRMEALSNQLSPEEEDEHRLDTVGGACNPRREEYLGVRGGGRTGGGKE